jgi:hypothetical protein
MKLLLLVSMFLIGCQTYQPRPHTYGGALREVNRGGLPEQYQPSNYDLVSHVCTSTPIFDLQGNFVRKDVRCW